MTLQELVKIQLQTGYSLNDPKCYSSYLKLKGWIKQRQPRKFDNTKYTGEEFCNKLSHDIPILENNIIAHIGGHHIVCIKKPTIHDPFKVFDTWDSTYKCIGNYWIKVK